MWRNLISRSKTGVTSYIFSINCHNFLSKHRRSLGFTNFCGTRHIHDAKWQMFQDNTSKKELNTFTYRTHTCGELRLEHNGQRVSLCGWVQYLRLSKFLLLRDAYGLTQCIIEEQYVDFANISLETIVKCDGIVKQRPKDMINKNMSTGEVEVVIQNLEILNTVSQLPFNLRDYQKPKEQLRLQHRYIDLRYPEMQYNLRLRSIMLHNMRKFLVEKHNFVEVETPTLFCRTPGGAREFVVPTHHPGLFYSLVQSPQQFKQILMSGGMDRYFQIARCYRDESTRPDRQPEFTQLDIELSFTNRDGVMSVIENLLFETFINLLPNAPFPRITYKEAMENYGTDKPNISYGLKLKDIKKIFTERQNDLKFGAYAIPYPEELGKLTAKYREELKNLKKKYNVSLFLNENILKEFGLDFLANIKDIVGQKSTIIAFGDIKNSCLCLGEVRQMLSSILKSKNMLHVKDGIEPLWVVDFPLFIQGDNGLETCHHPFTAPHPEDLHLLDCEPLSVRSLAYDIVINGNEIGGGSVRVHSLELQKKLFGILNIDSTKLGHFLNALGSGCPPHAGIALGIDRLMSVACNTQSIRDVIAFPKSHDGKDPLSGAPIAITKEDMKYYHIASVLPLI